MSPRQSRSAGAGVGFISYLKSVAWKKAELAAGYIKELQSNEELVFACRALDWNGGKLVVPTSLLPLLSEKPKKIISHERHVLHTAMEPGLTLSAMEAEPRLQV